MANLLVDQTKQSFVNYLREEVETSEQKKEPQKLPREYQEQLPDKFMRWACQGWGWFTGDSTRQINEIVRYLEESQQEEGEATVAKALKNFLGQKFTQCGADKARESLEPFFGEEGEHGKLFKEYGIDFSKFVEAMCSTDPKPNLKLEKGLFRDLVYSFVENFLEETEGFVKSDAPFERKMLELHHLLQLKPQESESPDFTGFDAFKYCAAFLSNETDGDVDTFIKKSRVESIEDFGPWVVSLEDADWTEGKVRACFDDKTILGAILDYQDRSQGHRVVQLLGMLSPGTLKIVQQKEKAKLGPKCKESSLGDPRAVCGPAMRNYIEETLGVVLEAE